MNTLPVPAFPPALADTTRFKAFLAMTITTDTDAGFVSDRRQEVKTQIKEIEKTRKSFTEPIMEAKTRIDQQAKTISAPLEAIVRVLDQKLIAWHESQEEIRRKAEEEKKAAALAQLRTQQAADMQAAVVTEDPEALALAEQTAKNIERLEAKEVIVSNKVSTPSSTTYVQKRWTFRVVDATAIPREFMLVDEVKIRKVVLAMKEQTNIPGIEAFQEASIGGK